VPHQRASRVRSRCGGQEVRRNLKLALTRRRLGSSAVWTVAWLAFGLGSASAIATSQKPTTLPLVLRTPVVRVVGNRVLATATIANSTRMAIRSTVGYLSVRRGARGDLTGVARFSVPRLTALASRPVHIAATVNPRALLLHAGGYALLICLDVDSQIQTFTVNQNCVDVGTISIASTGTPHGNLHAPDTLVKTAPPGVDTSSSAVLRFASSVSRSRFQCRLDGGPWVACRSPIRFTGLVDGMHHFAARAIDRNGAPDRTPAHVSWVTAMLAATPYMGWNTYYGVGGIFDENTILSVANGLIGRGLAKAGYRIVWLDFGWASGKRDGAGDLIIDPQQWPHGLAWLTAWLHGHGLLAGIYTDAGASGCSHQGVGSLGNYQRDANAFAAWGFDAVKLDFCGAGQEGLSPRQQYTQFATALANDASHRPMLLNVDNFWVPGQIDGVRPSVADSAYSNYQWARHIAQSWRTDTDIGFTRNVQFVNILRNLDHDAAHPGAAGPGHWNDPDYLGPELGMTAAEAQTQLSMWAIVAAPLILGSDPRSLSATSIAMLENRQVIAVDQDPLGVQGTPIQQQGAGQVWVKPLAGGDRAVALLNRGSTALSIATTATAVGLPLARGYGLHDLWLGTTRTTTGAIGSLVPPHSAVLYRVAVALP
jgi:hypothetical protein